MKYKVIENFIPPSDCDILIEESKKHLIKDDFLSILNNRKSISSSSPYFLSLLKKSKKWGELHKKLNSQEFLELIKKELKIEKIYSYKVTIFFFNEKPNIFLQKYKILNQLKTASLNFKSLLKYISFRLYRNISRIIKYKFTNENYLELLYDYSISPNGYKREIHRDSDARTFVFLLYLNNLSKSGEGGELEIYKYKKDKDKIPSRPRLEDCQMVESISPKPGRLVIFLNSFDSLHGVSEMKNHNEYRYFLYGSFTLLAKKNIYLNKSSGSLPTDYNLFD